MSGVVLTKTETFEAKPDGPIWVLGAGFQILDIRQYACGLKPVPADTLDQNPFFL